MTDKNCDFSQIRVGTVVSSSWARQNRLDSEQIVTSVSNGIVKTSSGSHDGDIDAEAWEFYGYYIVSQPEEHPFVEEVQVAVICEKCDGEGFLPETPGLCVTCKGQGQIYPQPEEQPVTDQESVRTREAQVMEFGHELISLRANRDCTELALAERHIIEAEARGYARRLAEEGGVITYDEALRRKVENRVAPALMGQMLKISKLISWAQNIHDQFGDTCVYDCGLSWGAVALNRESDDRKRLLPEGSTWVDEPDFEGSPQPDTRDETIAELRLSEMHTRADGEAAKAKIATLREALAALVSEFGCTLELYDRNGPSLSCADGEFIHASAIYDRREALDHAANALSATGDE